MLFTALMPFIPFQVRYDSKIYNVLLKIGYSLYSL